VLGDHVYGRATLALAQRLGLGRLALHAERLALPAHAGGRIELRAPLWPDLVELEEQLQAAWRPGGVPGPATPHPA
jgi:hypothetical protein